MIKRITFSAVMSTLRGGCVGVYNSIKGGPSQRISRQIGASTGPLCNGSRQNITVACHFCLPRKFWDSPNWTLPATQGIGPQCSPAEFDHVPKPNFRFLKSRAGQRPRPKKTSFDKKNADFDGMGVKVVETRIAENEKCKQRMRPQK